MINVIGGSEYMLLSWTYIPSIFIGGFDQACDRL